MARYSGPEDINEKAWEKLSDGYHEAAEEYLDMVLRDKQINPTSLTKKYDVLTQISIAFAKEKYLDSKAASSDGLTEQLERIRRDRIDLERRFLNGVVERIRSDIGSDSSTSAIGISSGRLLRA